jgi:potassium-transporting ATPase KdpC subunit
MVNLIRPTIVSLFIFTVLAGGIYPLAVTAIAQIFFPEKANGSIIMRDNKPAGSLLIGQSFDNPKYFWGRLSATSPFPYNSASSGGSNLSQTNPDLVRQAQGRISALIAADPQAATHVPIDLVTASGSGLDPHISPAAAEYQVKRIAVARGIDESAVRPLVAKYTDDRTLGLFGESRVNVLQLNLSLDEMSNPGQASKYYNE